MAFNHIYTVFREETTLIDQFSFEVLVVYVHSLALAHHDDKALGKMVLSGCLVQETRSILGIQSYLYSIP